MFKGDVMKGFFSVIVVVFLFSLSACNVKEAAKSVGDAGNSAGKTIDDTINRENVKKD